MARARGPAEIAASLDGRLGSGPRDRRAAPGERTGGGARTHRFHYRSPMAIEAEFIP